MPFSVIIPARHASTRLPGKPLLDVAGKPMLQHVWERSRRSEASSVIIATDDRRIAAAAEGWGAQVCMTDSKHASGTDRLHEVIAICGFDDEDLVVNVQGDEPLIPPEVINQVANNLVLASPAGMATLSEPLTDVQTLLDPDVVKVVLDAAGFAVYFSRAPVPYPRGVDLEKPGVLLDFPPGQWLRHIGIYAYRAGFLRRFTGSSSCGRYITARRYTSSTRVCLSRAALIRRPISTACAIFARRPPPPDTLCVFYSYVWGISAARPRRTPCLRTSWRSGG